MNRSKHFVGRIARAGLVLAVGGTVLASSCSTSDFRIILSGVESVTNQLAASDNNVSFSDWLSSALKH